MKDLYNVLGVARDADQASIRKAFKSLARTWHPDVNKAAGAEARFKEISAAYEVLGDEQKRALYDEFGEVSLQSGFDPERARAYKNMGGGGPFPGYAGGFGGGVDLGELFGNLFTGADGGGRPRGGARAGADIEGRVAVPFLHAVRGGEVSVELTRPTRCRACNGDGGTGRRPCPTCQGRGRRRGERFGMNVMLPCDECGGGGSVFTSECGGCGGTGRVRERRPLTVKIPPGVETGKVMRLRGQGGEGLAGGPAGDLLLTVEVGKHPLLRREGKDLEMDVPVSLAEAIAGATIEVPTPTGRLRVKVPAGSNSGRKLRVPGRGVQGAEAGDLYLVLRPVVPATSDPELLELARRLDAAGPADVRAELVL